MSTMPKEPKICIIDDNPEDREVFRRYLLQDTDYRYHLFEEDTGEKGLALCQAVQPDCILLDYNLPDIDGLEFLAELSGDSAFVSFPVVMLTGLDNEAVALQAMKRGAQDFLVKSETTAGNLFRAIHNAIERAGMRRTVEQQRHELVQKNQELQAFAYALAHDLRAPLRSIGSFAQIVQQDYAQVLDADGQHYVQNIVRASVQMDTLIDDLLSYTRIEHRAVRRKPVDLDYVVQQLVDSLAERVTSIQATLTISDHLPTVYGDPTLVNQIFVNLLDNALTYQRPGVPLQVNVGAVVEAGFAIINVTDNGIGIAKKYYERVFTIFQRLHSEEEYPGTGIGLAIVKKSVELLNGHIWIESILDTGTTFYVKLPLSKES